MRSVVVRLSFVSSLLFLVSIVSPSARASGAWPAGVPATTQTTPPTTVPATAPSSPMAAASAERGFALELSTGGLSSIEDGALGLGWGSSRIAGGLGLAFRYSSLTGPNGGDSTPGLTETTIAVGPWLRFGIAHWLDGRADLAIAFDAQYTRQSVSTKISASPTRAAASANGVTLRVGPGIRFWATPRIAFGYTTQLSLISLSGPLLAFTQSTVLSSSTDQFDQVQIALVGRFSVLALF